MRSARVRKPATGVSLFPFLAVLICTMGALIVLLIMVVQQARVQAHVETREQAEAAPEDGLSPEDLKRQQEDYEWRREILEKQRAELTQRLAEERNDLGHLEDHIRRLQDEWKQLVAQAEELNRTGRVKPDEKANIDTERERLKAALELAKREMDEAQKKVSTKPRSFAIIPYKGPNGTNRRPIYIECRGDAIIFQPEGVMLSPTDFDGPLGPGNPFDAALRATREYLERSGGNQGGEPYPLLVVRPDGAVAYALARSAMKSWDDEFGYELIDQDMKLAFPPPDPNLTTTLQRALGDARRRQEMLARVAPSRFKGIGSSRGGGGEGFDEHYGIGTGQGDGSGGNGTGASGNSRTPGTGGLAGAGSRAGGFGVPGANRNGGMGKPGSGDGQGGAGTPNSLAGGLGNGGGGVFYSDKPAFGKPGPIVSSGTSSGSGGTGLTPDESKPGGSGSGSTGTMGGGRNGTGAEGASSGNFAANSEAGETAVFGGRPGNGGQFGKRSSGSTSGSALASAGGGSSGSSGASSADGSSGASGGSAGGSSSGAQFGSQGGMPSFTIGQDPPPGGSSENSSTDRKPPKGRRRSSNWGLPNSAANDVGYTRPIRVACTSEKLVILPERGDGNAPQVVHLEDNSPAPIEDFVGAVWKHMDRWGSAGQRAYWKPTLSVQVAPGGEERFAELESQLKGSGLEVKRK